MWTIKKSNLPTAQWYTQQCFGCLDHLIGADSNAAGLLLLLPGTIWCASSVEAGASRAGLLLLLDLHVIAGVVV